MDPFDSLPADSIEAEIRRVFAPLEVAQVLACPLLKRAYVLVGPSQLALARALALRAEQRLLWEVCVLTADDLEERINAAVADFATLEGVSAEMAQTLVEQGYLSCRDLVRMNTDDFCELFGVDKHHAAYVLHEAARRAEPERGLSSISSGQDQ